MASAEEKRRHAVGQWRRQQKDRQRALATDIGASLDHRPSSSKRIKFHSDGSDESDTEKREKAASKSLGTINGGPAAALFDSDDDGGEPVDWTGGGGGVRFRAHVGGVTAVDKRFTVDESFMRPEGQGDEGRKEKKGDEKRKQITILSKVLGRSVAIGDASDQLAGSSAERRAPLVRFDPDNPDHYHMDLTNKNKKKAKDVQKVRSVDRIAGDNDKQSSSSSSESECEAEEKQSDSSHYDQEVASSTAHTAGASYHRMDESFAASLRDALRREDETETGAFSLLASLGRDSRGRGHASAAARAKPGADAANYDSARRQHSDNDKQEAAKLPKWQREVLSSSMEPSRSAVRLSSDDEQHGDNEPDASQLAQSCARVSKRSEAFFITAAEDERVQRAVDAFRRTQPLSTIERNWKKQRPALLKMFKRAHKDAARQRNVRLRQAMAHGKSGSADHNDTQGKRADKRHKKDAI